MAPSAVASVATRSPAIVISLKRVSTPASGGISRLLRARLPIAVLPVLRCPWLAAARRHHGIELLSQTLDLIQSRGLVRLIRTRLSRFLLTQSLLCLLELLAQFLKTLRDFVFRPVRVRVDAAAQPIRRSLHVIVEVRLVHLAERIAQLPRYPRL